MVYFVVGGLIGALRSAIGFWVGREGRARRVGHLIFKKEMPESFALGRYLGYLMRNSMSKAPCRLLCFLQSPPGGAASPLPDSRLMGNEDVAPPVWLNPCAKHLASLCDLHCHCMAQSTEMVAPCVVGCATLFHKIQLSKINALVHPSVTLQVRSSLSKRA